MDCDCEMAQMELMNIRASVNYGDGRSVVLSHDLPADVTLDELFQTFKAIAMGLTFQPGSWENVVMAEAEEIEMSRRPDLHDYLHPRRSVR